MHLRDQTTTAPWARALAFSARLRDGRRVRVRPITPADKGRIAAALDRMSARTRYFRFGAVRERLTVEELSYLTELDFDAHVAWGALAQDLPGAPGVGAARFVRDPQNPAEAEFAVTVVDAWQGLGLGQVLMQTLVLSAAERGVDRLVGYVLPDNRRALRAFEALGGQVYAFEDDLLVVEIPTKPAGRRPRISGAVLARLRATLGA